MKTLKTRGLVIRSLDYKDTSKIVYVFTPLGILSVRGVGSKRYKNKNFKFGEILTYIEMEITDSAFPSLIDYSVIDNFTDLKADIRKFFKYGHLLEFLSHFPNDIPYERVLDYILDTIRLGRVYNPSLLILMLEVKSLPLFGIKPELEHCQLCRKSNPEFISISRGGAMCTSHSDGSYLLEPIKRLYLFDLKRDDYEDLSDIDLKVVYTFIREYYAYHADVHLKSILNI